MSSADKSITKETVKSKIDAAEVLLTQCFDLLLDLKCAKNLDVVLTTFQPRLAECLYVLMQFYQELQCEKRSLIAMKEKCNLDDFRQKMKDNADYLRVVSDTIKIGKSLGDAFIWFFYRGNRNELDKHFEHNPTGLFTAGIGGRGELEFIKNNNDIDGLYVVYHGITDMLRVGDFSLYANEIGIVGVGELKTTLDGEKLTITASITSKVRFEVPNGAEANQLDSGTGIENLQKSFPSLAKQLEVQTDMMSVKESEYSSSLYVSYEHSLIDSLSHESPIAVNQDCSLLLLAAWSSQSCLFDVLYINETMELPEEFTERAKTIMEPDSPNNQAVISHLDTQTNCMRYPLFWWRIGDDVCKDIYFKRATIATVFNPAKLIQRFVDAGFEVKSMGRLREVELEKTFGDRRITFNHFESICDLVSHSLMKTGSAFESARKAIHACESGEVEVNTKVDLRIHLDNFGEMPSDKSTYSETVEQGNVL